MFVSNPGYTKLQVERKQIGNGLFNDALNIIFFTAVTWHLVEYH